MSKIPKKLLATMLADPFYKTCARAGLFNHACDGRVTFEHVLIYAGKQVQEVFAILPLCAFAHAVDRHQDGGDLNKEVNVWISLNRATDIELSRFSKVINYQWLKTKHNEKYGTYEEAKKRFCVAPQRIAQTIGIVGRQEAGQI